jgi:hypothetical protein
VCKEVSRVSKRKHYLRFSGDYRVYNLERKEQSWLYEVP